MAVRVAQADAGISSQLVLVLQALILISIAANFLNTIRLRIPGLGRALADLRQQVAEQHRWFWRPPGRSRKNSRSHNAYKDARARDTRYGTNKGSWHAALEGPKPNVEHLDLVFSW